MARAAPGRTANARGTISAIVIMLALGCRVEEIRPAIEEPGSTHPEPTREQPGPKLGPSTTEPEPTVEREPYTPASQLGAPIEIRKATGSRAVHAAPDPAAALRGRIQRSDSFHVYAHRDGPGCKKPWAQVADAGWVCLERTELDEHAEPRPLPIVADGELLPFIYVRHGDHDDPGTPAIPVYANVSAFNRGDAPIETLPAYGSYAFVRSLKNRGAKVYLTASRRAVPAERLREFKPSEFAGERLEPDTIPPGATLAWAVRWKTLIRAAADPEAEVVGRVGYHDSLWVSATDGVIGSDGERWFQVLGEQRGWISDHDVRRFLPVAPPAPILAGQLTVDVDLAEQVLSVWREDQPVFATLISSGKPGDATPLGLYRIETKWAYSKMESLASADEPYYVDAVPWAMYFDGRYALHAAYWHDLFGHRLSHGCVNLSPRDARHV
ncbi:MAG TPA: L,D-transpeptidase family protein, partial [Enhygromyxa sp.]|nr:L,D-transpeptidase family protein [Enhygromyxa sp.]